MAKPKSSNRAIELTPRNLNPPEILKDSLRASDMTSSANSLFNRWPTMKDAAQRYAGLLTRIWPLAGNESLSYLDFGLAEAVRAAGQAYQGEGDVAERNAFVLKLTESFSLSLASTLCCETRYGLRVYDPFEHTLVEWIKEYRPNELDWENHPHPCQPMPAGK